MDAAEVFRTYKIPILLGGISVLAIVISIVLLVKSTQTVSEPIQFSSDTAEASGSAQLTIDVEGAVVNPGLYSLPGGSRVEDAITAAGGLGNNADTDAFAKTFNRATKLTDGAKIYIPKIDTSGTDQTSHIINTTQNGMVNVNTASESELDALPGVGPVTAQKIIDNRPYMTLDDLVAKKAIGTALFSKIKDQLSL